MFQIEAVLQIRSDIVGQTRGTRGIGIADMQIELHREFPVQPRAVRRFEQKIAFADGAPLAPQRHVRRDEARRRSVREEESEQALGVDAEPRELGIARVIVERLRRGIERGEPRRASRRARVPRRTDARAARRCCAQQVRREQQPREIADRDVVETIDETRKLARRAAIRCRPSALLARRRARRAPRDTCCARGTDRPTPSPCPAGCAADRPGDT